MKSWKIRSVLPELGMFLPSARIENPLPMMRMSHIISSGQVDSLSNTKRLCAFARVALLVCLT
jgi:hypothetical protein